MFLFFWGKGVSEGLKREVRVFGEGDRVKEGGGKIHWRGGLWRYCVDEEGRFDEEGLVSCQFGRGVAGADVQGDDWRFEIAVRGSECFHPEC